MTKLVSNYLVSSKNKMSEGLFGMVILYLIEVLPILEKKGIDTANLTWDITTKSYNDIFPKILEYTSSNKIRWFLPRKKLKLEDLRSMQPQYVLGNDFEKLNKLFFKYFKIPKVLEDKAASFNLENTLGIHFRGTDKTTDTKMNTSISKEEFYIIFDSFIRENPYNRVFLATDENDLFTTLRAKYPQLEIISSRAFDNQNIFWKNNQNPTKNGQEAMIDMLCLSKCKVVLKVSSALSAFAKLINPKLVTYRLNALKMFTDIPYFPDAYIPLLPQHTSFTEECNRVIEKVQKDDWSITNKESNVDFYIKER